MPSRSKLVKMIVKNLGCIGPKGIEIALDDIVCIVGKNNVGKSTILRAYELAQGSRPVSPDDCCQFGEGLFPEVELWVHIPEGTGNIASKWKESVDDLLIVRSRWTWTGAEKAPTRQTWDPEANDGAGAWAEDGKAGGLDAVFKSRLPQPLRIGALQDATKEHEELLKLVTEPLANDLKGLLADQNSALAAAMEKFVQEALKPVEAYKQSIEATTADLQDKLRGVFPGLSLKIDVSLPAPSIDPNKQLVQASSVMILDGGVETKLRQQGTGSQRALFWALLQVRNAIQRTRQITDHKEKERAKLEKQIEKERTRRGGGDEAVVEELLKKIEALDDPAQADDIALPGHILLIDEPENALHPMAIRSAQQHLYALASSEDWQVMLTTHSPYFINPLEDHTTIIRMERSEAGVEPRTFRASTGNFSKDDKEDLRALLQLDISLCEMFFGSYPVLVEGDTEQAAFIAAVLEKKHELGEKVALVRARGKALLVPLVRLLTHFGVPFGILHDVDSPYRSDGKKNSAWTENGKILESIKDARLAGISVRHRVSVPDFERRLGGVEESKDKPLATYRRVRDDAALQGEVQKLFLELYESDHYQPFDAECVESAGGAIEGLYITTVLEWAAVNDPKGVRYYGAEPVDASA